MVERDDIQRREGMGLFSKLMGALTVAALITTPALADACTANSCNDVKITRLYVTTSLVYVEIDGDTSELNCTYADGGLVLRNTHGNFDAVYALLLTVFQSGDNIARIRLVDQSSPCEIQYVWQTN